MIHNNLLKPICLMHRGDFGIAMGSANQAIYDADGITCNSKNSDQLVFVEWDGKIGSE